MRGPSIGAKSLPVAIHSLIQGAFAITDISKMPRPPRDMLVSRILVAQRGRAEKTILHFPSKRFAESAPRRTVPGINSKILHH